MKETRPTSIRSVRPERRTLAAARLCEGISSVRLKSPPVPLGKIPSSTSLPEERIPLATSEIVPSPPQAIMNFVPLRAASLASAAASPRCLVKSTRNGPNCERKSLAICGHASPVPPVADAGLTITVAIIRVIRGLFLRVLRFCPSPHLQSLCACAIDQASPDARSNPTVDQNVCESLPRDSSCVPPASANYYTTQL